jgi:ubiquitin carboxyl-terminal hydrolase 1
MLIEQALASLPDFQSYLESINEGPEVTPVTAATADLLKRLNTPHPFSTALHPDQVARALMQSDKNRLLATREQQDAQEFFSLLLDTLESESSRRWLTINKPSGLETIIDPSLNETTLNHAISVKTLSTLESPFPSPFEGLSAHRMGCLKCKYVENIRHEKQGPMVLSLTMTQPTTLKNCLDTEFEMETISEVDCQKCTLLAYKSQLSKIIENLSKTPCPPLENAKARLEAINNALLSGKIDDPKLLVPAGGEKEIKKFTVRSEKSKHHMIARSPRLLALHIQRSNFHNFTGRALKNQAPVEFPVMLDFSEYVTNSTLSMDPTEPISVVKEGDIRTIYSLRSVVVHYGLHHMGHYVAYRRTDNGWFRISDEDVEYVSICKLTNF